MEGKKFYTQDWDWGEGPKPQAIHLSKQGVVELGTGMAEAYANQDWKFDRPPWAAAAAGGSSNPAGRRQLQAQQLEQGAGQGGVLPRRGLLRGEAAHSQGQ